MDFQPPPPPPRSVRLAELRRTVERSAPAATETKPLSKDELAEVERVREQRNADRACASREGRSALVKKLQASVERLTGSTPPEGIPLPG